ncbi:DUF3152 domain-containing protein [Micromonospora pattaloongensis]|uniref:DUF3152 domain-containing protein n=1 Tax=Micromonospora pattaloongensis TaxID=405436 RepID=UPI001FDF86E8|nr:DUF3152 domain-containing protein [Micromonospora pattaloongensis]
MSDGEDRTGSPRRDGKRLELAARIARDRMRQRRRRVVVIVILLASAGLVGLDLVRGAPPQPTPPAGAPTAGPADDRSALPGFAPVIAAVRPTAAAVPGSGVPVTGPGTFRYAAGQGSVLGKAGTLRRFRVAVEDGMGQSAAEFAAAAERILGDQRSWTASRQFRLQRVPKSASAEFTLFLATAGTSERMCAAGGLRTDKFTSCRLPGQVIINVARWLGAIPDYGAPLADYQAYAINHEVGHQLGQGHEACPGAGQRAPVMQQQTYGLKGCRANAWPYLNGRRYAGPPIP